jgi:hypothetical protein
MNLVGNVLYYRIEYVFFSNFLSVCWYCFRYYNIGRAVAQAVSPRLPTAAAQVRVRAGMWGLLWTKRHWGRFYPSTSVSTANRHSTSFSIIIITRGCQNRPIGGRSAEWTQLDSNPPLYQFNYYNNSRLHLEQGKVCCGVYVMFYRHHLFFKHVV